MFEMPVNPFELSEEALSRISADDSWTPIESEIPKANAKVIRHFLTPAEVEAFTTELAAQRLPRWAETALPPTMQREIRSLISAPRPNLQSWRLNSTAGCGRFYRLKWDRAIRRIRTEGLGGRRPSIRVCASSRTNTADSLSRTTIRPISPPTEGALS